MTTTAPKALSEAGNPCLFIVGCLRSGTTMFRHIVDAHPDLAVVNETQWLPRWFEHRRWRPGLHGDGSFTRAALPELFSLERFARLDVNPADAEGWLVDEPVPYVEFVGRLFDAHGRAHGKALIGEKSPGYIRHLPTLCALWPKARIVHLVRDGRDVYLSLAGWKPEKQARTIGRFTTWSTEPIITAALWWEWHVRLGLEAAQQLEPGQYHQLRYEDLVADPPDACQELCRFLRLPYDEAMLRFHEHHTQPGSTPPRRGPALPVTPGLRDWRNDLDHENVALFEAAAGDLLDQLGYERTTSRDDRHAARIEPIRQTFRTEAAAHRHRVPNWREHQAKRRPPIEAEDEPSSASPAT